MTENDQGLHGGNIYRASGTYGLRQEEILDYSANINPFGIPEALKETLISSIQHLIHYPDPDCTGLKNSISEYLDISPEKIIVGNGASEVIFLLFEVLGIKKVLIPAPTFIEYARAAEESGAQVAYFQLKEEEGFKLDVRRLCENIPDSTEAVFLCNPNNPTSTLLEKQEILTLIQYAKDHGLVVIIDEAFIELTPGANANSCVEFLEDFDNLFIIRAFTKIFAVPGLRIGYGLGKEAVIRQMWEKKLLWSVNSLACAVGNALPAVRNYLDETCHWIAHEKEWFYNKISSYREFKAFKPETNFMLVKILDRRLNAAQLRARMARKGILIRDASNFMFLDDRFFRVAIKDRESNIRFLEVLNEVVTEAIWEN